MTLMIFLLLLFFSGTTVQPICIPHRGDKFEEGILCMASGWGKTSESKRHQKNVIFLLGLFTCPLESGILLVLNNTFILVLSSLHSNSGKTSGCLHQKKAILKALHKIPPAAILVRCIRVRNRK